MSFPFDRTGVPTFYTPKDSNNNHHAYPGQVFAKTDRHFQPGWITVGYVSRQTPFGQGTYLGFRTSELREATMEEVLSAIERGHPHGSTFIPRTPELLDSGFHLLMSKAFSNWPVRTNYQSEVAKQEALMARWDEITARQIEAIKKHYKVS